MPVFRTCCRQSRIVYRRRERRLNSDVGEGTKNRSNNNAEAIWDTMITSTRARKLKRELLPSEVFALLRKKKYARNAPRGIVPTARSEAQIHLEKKSNVAHRVGSFCAPARTFPDTRLARVHPSRALLLESFVFSHKGPQS